MTAYLIVRATTPADLRERFDVWYQAEHLPDALRAFGAQRAERGWSEDDPCIHIALYAFSSLAEAQVAMASEATADLIVEFDRVWQGRVTRVREVIEVDQSLSSASA